MFSCLAILLLSLVYVLRFIGIPLSVVAFGSIVCFVVFVFLLSSQLLEPSLLLKFLLFLLLLLTPNLFSEFPLLRFQMLK